MKLVNLIAGIALALGAASGVQAKAVHDWHDGFECKDCHDQGIKSRPSDESCLTCHDVDDLAEQTKRKGDEEWQNPHNNLHYGKDLPCVECHNGHTDGKKQPLCNDCHTFSYDKFKG